MRTGTIKRKTRETDIEITLTLDGGENRRADTGVPFFDHMLDLFLKHGFMDGSVVCHGDVEVDAHHTVEDVGIALGGALRQALGDMRGITRYGSFLLPMDETLVQVALDISGRPFLVYNVNIPAGGFIGEMDGQLFEEFFRAFSVGAGLTLHINQLYGKNYHHIAEAAFKGVGRALAQAVSLDERAKNTIPSTKGVI